MEQPDLVTTLSEKKSSTFSGHETKLFFPNFFLGFGQSIWIGLTESDMHPAPAPTPVSHRDGRTLLDATLLLARVRGACRIRSIRSGYLDQSREKNWGRRDQFHGRRKLTTFLRSCHKIWFLHGKE
ncbi:hypothetical protein KY285_024798 [Solanum tuberosum]|nr:hypothetical protein KY285_024798 [Solanum tuberosum]